MVLHFRRIWSTYKNSVSLLLAQLFLLLLVAASPSYAVSLGIGHLADSHSQVTRPVANVLFIDAAVQSSQLLASGVGTDTDVIYLQSDTDGVRQITDALKAYSNLGSIQIVSHGSPGQLTLGSTALSDANISHYQTALQAWGGALKTSGDILLYGCNVAQGDQGDRFVDRIGKLTGASVAASVDATGSSALGGNWLLEKQTGPIHAQRAIANASLLGYTHLLASISAQTIADFDGRPAADLGATITENTFTFSYSAGSDTIWGDTTGKGSSGSPSIVLGGANGDAETLTITHSSGSTFKFTSFFVNGGGWGHGTWTITGKRGGLTIGAQTVNTGTDGVSGGISGVQTLSGNTSLENVDTIIISLQAGAAGFNTSYLDTFVFDPAVLPPPTATTGSASSISATGATLQGTVNDNGATTTVTFDHGPTNSYGTNVAATTGGTVTAGTGATAAAVTLSGLSCNTTYHFRVKGTNSAGTTNGSDATFTTSACVPGAPTIGTATAGNAQASVTFTAPASNGGAAITTYTATASPGGATGNCAGPAACTITVPGLTNGSAYTFSVTATNSAGTSSASAASNSVTPVTVPGAPTIGTATAGNAQATVTFTAPASDGGTAITTYTATSSPGSFTGTCAGPTACSITVNGLTNGSAYTFSVTATNSAGTGSASAASNSVTPATVPGAPTIGTATAGDAQASVTFSAPGSNGGAAITSYTATSSPGGFTSTGCTVSPCTVTGLTNGMAYTFTVTATNSVGTGAASVASNSVTPKAAQTITFNNPGPQTFGTTPTLSATASSGLTPTFTSSTTGVCTISSGGALVFVTAGTCTINADQAGDATRAAAPQVSQPFTVNAIVPTAPTIGTATAGDTQASVTFTAPASNGGAAITTYTATASPGGATGTCAGPAACTITVPGLTNGTAYTFTVTATNSAGTGSASAASNSVTPKATQTITFANPGAKNFGTTPTLTATSSSSLTVTFTSSTTSVCTISSGGTLAFVSVGNCTINADQVGNGTYLAAPQVSQPFAVNAVVPGAPTIGTATAGDTQASVSFTAPGFNGGATITSYTVTANPSGVTASSAASPITINGLTNGMAYTFTVRATNSAGTGSASSASNSVTPNPGPAVVSVAVPANGRYSAGQNLDFTVTWDQATTVTGTPRIALTIGASTVQTNYVSSPTATTTLFRYTVLAGQTDSDGVTVGALTLNGGTIQNAANTNATLTLNSVGSTTNVLVDTTAPTLPAANIVVNNQSDPHKVVLTFSEALASGSLGSAAGWTVTANGGSPAYSVASVALTGGNQVTLTLNTVDVTNAATTITSAAANAHLKVMPPASLTDVAGNTYAAGQVTESGSTHLLDNTPPTLSAVATSGATASGGIVAATASEKALGYWIAVASGSAAPTVAQAQAGVNYGAVTVVAHGSGALPNATPGSIALTGLSPSTAYDIHVVAQDAAGNLSAAISSATLSTSAAPNPFTSLPTAPPILGIDGLPVVVNMGSGQGPAIINCLLDMLRQILGGNAAYLGQTDSGEVRVGWNGQIISFYPLAASTTDARSTGLHAQGTHPLDAVTSCGSLNVTPALFNPVGFGAMMTSMGLTAQINAQGVITVLFNGSYYVVRPDYVVSTGTPGGPSLGFGADGLLRFTDAYGNMQILRPAVLDPAALQTQVGLMGGSMVVQLDATVLVAFGNGQQFVLTPDLVLGAIPLWFPPYNSWLDGPTRYRYRIMTAPYTAYSQGLSFIVKP